MGRCVSWHSGGRLVHFYKGEKLMAKIGVVFATTGGTKILRAVRSLKKMEPDIKPNVVVDVNSATWRDGGCWVLPELERIANVRQLENKFHINGALNEGMKWMKENGCEYGCLFHDDIVFPPFSHYLKNLSSWFASFSYEKRLVKASAVTLALIETGITGPDGDLFT